MTHSDPSHTLQLRLQKLESRITYGGAAIVAIAAVFGITGIKTITDAQDKLSTKIEEISEGEISTRLSELLEQAQTQAEKAGAHFEAVQAYRSDLCPDSGSIEKFGQCIFPVRASGGHCAMNYGAADAACVARGARLCGTSEVREAHAKGFDYCAFTWVADLEGTSRPSSDPTYNRTGTVVMSIPADRGRKGCQAGFSVRDGQNLLTQNANAMCCS